MVLAITARSTALAGFGLDSLIEELGQTYLAWRGGNRLRPEPVETAWEWALRPWRATTAMMTGSAKSGYDVFDYLVDITQRDATPQTFVPESTLRVLVDHADGPAAMTIGSTAHDQGYYAVAADALAAAVRWNADHAGPEHPDTLTSRNNLALVQKLLRGQANS